MQLAGVTKVFFIIREGKWDIPAYFGCGKDFGFHLAYLLMNEPFGVPFTLDQASFFVRDDIVVFGFPDILFEPDDAYVHLLAKKKESDADIVLGLFHAHQTHRKHMVALNSEEQICEIQIKPMARDLCYTWIIAVWAPSFTHFMHEYVTDMRKKSDTDMRNREVFFSDVVNAAIKNDLQVDRVIFDTGIYVDIGTPENLAKVSQMTSGTCLGKFGIKGNRHSA
jgi:glucose-1-phosphate thymidylyltransferase